MDLDKYIQILNSTHVNKPQKGFELNDRLVFIEEFLSQLDYTKEELLFDVSQSGKSPDIRLYGKGEKKSKQSMSRFVIETKNYDSLHDNIDNIDFQQLKNYIIRNSGRIKYIASTDYKNLFLFHAEVLLNEGNIDINNDSISKKEIYEFKRALINKFDLFNLDNSDKQKLEMLSQRNLFEEYDFPNPELNGDRFDISKKPVRENFIKTLYFLMEEIDDDISSKFGKKFEKFCNQYELINKADKQLFCDQFGNLLADEEYVWVKNFFLWAIQMGYIQNFITKPCAIQPNEVEKILKGIDTDYNDYYYNGYIATCIYSIINKTLFIRILEDSPRRGMINPFLKGLKESRYLSNGILHEKYIEGNLKPYLRSVFDFKAQDLKLYGFVLKKDIFDWVIDEIEDHNIIHFLRVFNEIYLNKLDQDILGDIYEHYLEAERDETSDKSYRRLLGQYYTPRPIVRLMWTLIRETLKTEKSIDVYAKQGSLLQILDPFMGSGTFLNEAVLQMKSSDSGKKISSGEVYYFFKDRSDIRKIEDSLTGFELNPLSCTIADINVYFRLIKSFSPEKLKDVPIKELNLIRTNTFDLDVDNNNKESAIQASLFSEDIKSTFVENKKTIDAKTKKYDIIVGNPPYGHINPTDFMKDRLLPFAFPKYNFDKNGFEIDFDRNKYSGGRIPEQEKNRGRLRDMYAYAFGVADRLINDSGIICFITSNTYLTLPTYKFIRKYWLNNYTIKYIINFNYVNEKANSMFTPEASIATSIILLINKKPTSDYTIKFLDLSDIGSIKQKYDFFCSINWNEEAKDKNDIISYEIKDINELPFLNVDQSTFLSNCDYEFVISNDLIKKIQSNTIPLKTYGKIYQGIQTGNDAIFVHDNISSLKKNLSDFIAKLPLEYVVKDENIHPCIQHQDLEPYGLKKITNIYYDKNLEKLLNTKKVKITVRLRDEGSIKSQNKLIIGAHNFYVDVKGRLLTQNCIDSKNLYFLTNPNLNVLYYLCGILNSNLGRYYRMETKLDTYDTFPIVEIANNEINEELVTLVREVHLLKSDILSLEKGKLTSDSQFFKDNISDNIQVYALDQENEYFKLIVPEGLMPSILVENPEVDQKDNEIINLNRYGLKLKCKTSQIANHIFSTYLKGAFGQIPELDLSINISSFDNDAYMKMKEQTDQYVQLVEKRISELVYMIYFGRDGKRTGINVLDSEEVKTIEKKLTNTPSSS